MDFICNFQFSQASEPCGDKGSHLSWPVTNIKDRCEPVGKEGSAERHIVGEEDKTRRTGIVWKSWGSSYVGKV